MKKIIKSVLLTMLFVMLIHAFSTIKLEAANLNKKKITLNVGSTYQLKVQNNSKKVKWSSTNKKIATVKKGIVTAKAKGTAQIKAKISAGKTYICQVTVVPKAKLNKKTLNLTAGSTYQLEVKNAFATVQWTSSNKKIAAVSKKGKVTAKAKGTATITAKHRNQKISCKVTVKKKPSSANNSANNSKVKYYAHRGYSGKYPENTMTAFKGAMSAGYDGIEFDMFETKSGDLIVFHDSTTDRMCLIQDSIYNVSKKTGLITQS